jgi:NDP-sugar pyrophosphorylase family protein
VIILAGGLGTRLRPVLRDRPKGLAPIGRDTFLEIQIRQLRRQGARHFALCVGHGAGQIESTLGDGSRLRVRIDYSVEQGSLLGTAGALKQAEQWFVPRALVLNGDTYFDIDHAGLVRFHNDERRRHSATVASLALGQMHDASRYSAVGISGRCVRAFHEKAANDVDATWFNGGAYIIERDLLERLLPGNACSLERELFPQALAAGQRLAAKPYRKPFFDIGTPDGLGCFREYYLRNRRAAATAR